LIYLIAALVAVAILLLFTMRLRPQDLPEPLPVLPWQHLEDRKAAIYENLRDVIFEYRVGKLSDADYQRTKQELQAELAGVLAEIDKIKQGAPAKPSKAPAAANKCPHCGAKFDKPLKFCGDCGKPMHEATA
jgi:hypothetical protein